MARALFIALLALTGCKQTRCIEPPAECPAITVDAIDTGGGARSVRILAFTSSACAYEMNLFCEIGSYDAALATGTSRRFYLQTPEDIVDPFGEERFVIEEGDAFGMACIVLGDGDAQLVDDCVDADCGDPSAENVALDAAEELESCRASGFFVPFQIQ